MLPLEIELAVTIIEKGGLSKQAKEVDMTLKIL